MKSFSNAVIVFAISIISLSAGNVLLKIGMDRLDAMTAGGTSTAAALMKIPQVPLGVLLLTAQFLGTLTLFKWGWEASVVVPVMGLCYVGTALLEQWMLHTPVNGTRWLGIGFIVLGVFFVARSVVPGKS